jgi:formate dehydrogenase maturation protein FdhE
MVRLSRKTENWFDTVTPTVKNRPKDSLLSTGKKRTAAEGSKDMCPKCGSNKVSATIVDETDPKQPIIHCICESCDLEWVE